MKAIDEGGQGRGHHLRGIFVDGDDFKKGALRAEMENGSEGKCEWWSDVIFTNHHTKTKQI